MKVQRIYKKIGIQLNQMYQIYGIKLKEKKIERSLIYN